MKEKVYVDRLFANYEDTPEINDFKEEITANLKEHIKALVSEGLSEEKAFDTATAELGDITAIADDVGKKKRNEAMGQMYLRSKVPITKKTAGGLAIASGLLLLAVGMALIGFFSKTNALVVYHISTVLLSVSGGLFTFFGLTQETAAHYAMKKRRAFAYGVICSIAFLGTGTAVVSFLVNGLEMSVSLGIKMAFILPAVCAFIFLLATEPKRHKPWLKAMIEQEHENAVKFHMDRVDPLKSARFGVLSGGLWVLAIAVFMTLGYTIGWTYAWLVFLFALAVQIFMTAMVFNKRT